MSEDLVPKLAAIPLFAHLDEGALSRIAGIVTEFEVPAGHVLVRAGDPGAGLFLIQEGVVVVNSPGRDIELGSGECLGELALLDDRGMHVARARAKTPVRACAIDRDHFMELLGSEPSISIALLRVLAHRLADAVAGWHRGVGHSSS